jgi:hypothetical protein
VTTKKVRQASKQSLVELCKLHGIMLLDDGDVISVDAPVGQCLQGNNLHDAQVTLSSGWHRGEAYAFLMDEIGTGLIKCEDPECESCIINPMTFDEIQALYRGERLA